MDAPAPKKSDSIDIRLPHATKQAFMAQCRAEGRTASDAIRGFVEMRLRGEAPGRRHRLRPVARAAGAFGMIAGLSALLTFSAGPVAAAPDFGPGFALLDRNHDGVVTPAEYGGVGQHERRLSCGVKAAIFVKPLSRYGAVSGSGVRPFAVSAYDFRFSELDANHDGRISPGEYRQHWLAILRQGFAELDLNHDGKLSRQEYARIYQTAYLGDPPDIAPFLELDRNRDGRIDWQEFIV